MSATEVISRYDSTKYRFGLWVQYKVVVNLSEMG
jgi:hypothetical protein